MDSLRILNEEYNSNKIGNFYMMEFDTYKDGRKLFMLIAVFIRKNWLFSVLALSDQQSEVDRAVYSWIFRNAAGSLTLKQ